MRAVWHRVAAPVSDVSAGTSPAEVRGYPCPRGHSQQKAGGPWLSTQDRYNQLGSRSQAGIRVTLRAPPVLYGEGMMGGAPSWRGSDGHLV